MVIIDPFVARVINVFLTITGSFIFCTVTAEALNNVKQASQVIKETSKTVTITVTTGVK